MTTLTTLFDHANPAHRELKAWRQAGTSSWRAHARQYASTCGEAKVWRANDSVIRFWAEDGKVRQRTYRRAVHVNRAAPQAEVAAQDQDYRNTEMREDLDKVWDTLEMTAEFAHMREL